MFKRLIASLTVAASAAFLFPLSFMPDAVEKCADPSWQFLTQGPLGSTVVAVDSPARAGFCRVVADNAAL